MATAQPCDDTRLYLVRIWHRHRQFRASVRAVDEEAQRLFSTPAEVAEFLAQAGHATPRTVDEPSGDQDDDRP